MLTPIARPERDTRSPVEEKARASNIAESEVT